MPEPTTTVADQPTTTVDGGGEVESSAEYVPSFARDDAEPESTAEETPETQTAGDEGEAEPEAQDAGAESEVAGAGEGDETSQDDFLASLDPAEVAYYAKRYPTLYRAYQDPNQPADLRQAFVDRVNQDHAYAELRDGSGEGEPTSDQPEPVAQPTDQTQVRQQYYAQIDDMVANQIDQNAINEMGSNLLDAMGVDLKSNDPEIQAIVKNAPKVGKVLARGALDLMATALPNILASRIEMTMPGITRMYYRSMYSEVWDGLRNRSIQTADGQASKPYAKLPTYGSAQFQAAIDKAVAEFPGLEEMTFRDKQGQVLPPREQAERKYQMLAKMMTGQQVNPAVVAQAIDTGKKLARTAQIQRAAGKALGAGRTTSEFRGKPTGNEDIFGPGMEEYKRRGG